MGHWRWKQTNCLFLGVGARGRFWGTHHCSQGPENRWPGHRLLAGSSREPVATLGSTSPWFSGLGWELLWISEILLSRLQWSLPPANDHLGVISGCGNTRDHWGGELQGNGGKFVLGLYRNTKLEDVSLALSFPITSQIQQTGRKGVRGKKGAEAPGLPASRLHPSRGPSRGIF